MVGARGSQVHSGARSAVLTSRSPRAPWRFLPPNDLPEDELVRVGFCKLPVILGLPMLLAQAAIGAVTFEPERNLSDSETTSAIPEISPQPLAFDKSGRVVVVWSEFATPE